MFKGRFSKDGKGFIFSDFFKKKLLEYMRANPNTPFEIVPKLIESDKQRGWFEGAFCPLVAFYQEGMDHRNYKDIKLVREWMKMEFNSELVGLAGKTHKIAKSTKNELNGFLEKAVNWFIDSYSPPIEALDTKYFKHWHDTIFPNGGPDNYIDYLLKVNILHPMNDTEYKEENNLHQDLSSKEVEDLREDGPNYSLAQDED